MEFKRTQVVRIEGSTSLPRVARRLDVNGGDYYELLVAVLEREAEALAIDHQCILTDRELLEQVEKAKGTA